VNVYELLVSARNIYAERGGAKGELEKLDTGQVCGAGALNIAATGSAMWWPLVMSPQLAEEWVIANHLLNELVGSKDGFGFSHFNDRQNVTKNDVLAMFDKAIAGLEEQA